jgi:hypothetical protein
VECRDAIHEIVHGFDPGTTVHAPRLAEWMLDAVGVRRLVLTDSEVDASGATEHQDVRGCGQRMQLESTAREEVPPC